jgi:hypothetical protein
MRICFVLQARCQPSFPPFAVTEAHCSVPKPVPPVSPVPSLIIMTLFFVFQQDSFFTHIFMRF